ncbi:pallilysin-related adhesin [Alkalispirochaeta americana]|uniref:pallilysin-related adhesin n=1 Tax=Alkalispirochaeta americana TaxID=159291 RepID=UPI000970AAC9|nr:pallilysin-related adhesin [Alkalispirochaeta americana]
MKETTLFPLALCLLGGLALFSCTEVQESSAIPHRTEVTLPGAAPGIILAREETRAVSIQTEDEDVGLRVNLSDEYLLISTHNVSLTMSEPDEQIVVVKRRDDPSDRVRLLVAIFDPLRNIYRVSWEGVTEATGMRSFSVSTMDLTGDHQEEIIGTGIDPAGKQTINVFRQEPRERGQRDLLFREIFSGTTDGSIEIADRRRSDAYRTLQSTGESFPILLFQRNDQTEDPHDLIRSEYRWNAESGQYHLAHQEELPGVQAEQAQLRELYDADTAGMEQFLSGPWFRSTESAAGSPAELAFFDTANQRVSLFHSDAQEQYEWVNSYKAIYQSGPGLLMNLRNAVLRTVRRQIAVTVLGTDTIRINVDGAEYWNGQYQRMTPGIQEGTVRNHRVSRPDFILQGVYRNENHQEILFDAPHFRFRSDRFDWRGGFNLMQPGSPLLELKIVEATGDASADVLSPETGERTASRVNGSFNQRYRLEYSEERSEDRVVRRIHMTPVVFTVDGLVETGAAPVVLEQVEEFLEEAS